MASKLPEANLLLLQHLLSLLQNISGNVATSKMTARNLAICLGPNLLSPPQELPLDVLVQEMEKVAVFTTQLQPPPPTPALLLRGPWLPPPISKAVGQQLGRAAPRLHLPAQKRGSGWERLFEPVPDTSVKPAVCCVQVTQLVEFLIDHHEELLGEEVAGLASHGDEEPPAPQMAPETAEVCEVHKQRDNKSLLPQKVGLLPRGQARSSPSLQLCQSAKQG